MTLALVLAACGSPPPPVPEGPCADAYAGIVASLEDMFRRSGTPQPIWPDEAEYVQRCEALSLDEKQLHCLDPAASSADPAGCRDALRPVQADVDRLAKWFGDHTTRAGGER